MKNVYNWLFGSFFRTLGRVIVYILLGYLLSFLLKDLDISSLFLMNVNADTNVRFITNYDGSEDDTTYYNNNLTTLAGLGYIKFNRFQAYNCSSSTSCTSSFGNSVKAYSGGQVISGVSIANYGIDIAHTTEVTMSPNHLYSYTQLVCYETNPSLNSVKLFVNSGVGTNRRNQITPLYTNYYYVSSIKWEHWNTGGTAVDIANGNCYTYYYLFNNNEDSTTIKTNIITSAFTNKKVNFVGYKLEDLGATDYVTINGLQNIISNSGLATASSVNEVKTSVQQVQTELNNVNTSIENQTNQQNQNHQETINTLKDDNTTEANNKASEFFNNFSTNTHGLTGIITAPLSAIQSLTSQTCEPLTLPLPFINQDLTLPCMRPIYQEHFGAFMNIYDIITLGIVSYWVMVRIFGLVKDFKNPDHDEVEVLDL